MIPIDYQYIIYKFCNAEVDVSIRKYVIYFCYNTDLPKRKAIITEDTDAGKFHIASLKQHRQVKSLVVLLIIF